MQHNSLFVFDIETIPDTNAVAGLVDYVDPDADTFMLREMLTQYHLDITDGKNPFPRQPFHKVVAISFLSADIHYDGKQEYYSFKELRSGGTAESSEEELLRGFFQYFSKSLPRLVSFNGRCFDLPVLKYRAMAYGVPATALYKYGDKWNNYQQRYSLDWHCDLLEAFSDFGASARIKMNEACSIFGFPGKVGVDGSKVTDLYDAGNIDAIRDYCETDVLNTFLLYLRYQHHTGTLATEHYNHIIEDIVHFIHNEGGNKAHLNEFLEAWNTCSHNQLTLGASNQAA